MCVIRIHAHFSIKHSICLLEQDCLQCDCSPLFSLSLALFIGAMLSYDEPRTIFSNSYGHTNSEPARSLARSFVWIGFSISTSFTFRPRKHVYLYAIVWIVVRFIDDGYGGNDDNGWWWRQRQRQWWWWLLLFLLLRWLACTWFSIFIRIRIRVYVYKVYVASDIWYLYGYSIHIYECDVCWMFVLVRQANLGPFLCVCRVSLHLCETLIIPFACTTFNKRIHACFQSRDFAG